MKGLLKILLFTLIIAPFGSLYAQQNIVSDVEKIAIDKNDKFGILLQTEAHFTAAIIAAEEYKNRYPTIEFHIVMIGPIVKQIAQNQDLQSYIETAKEKNIILVSCEFAMNKLGVEKSDYHSWVQTTPNAFSYIFKLKKLGFSTLEL